MNKLLIVIAVWASLALLWLLQPRARVRGEHAREGAAGRLGDEHLHVPARCR